MSYVEIDIKEPDDGFRKISVFDNSTLIWTTYAKERIRVTYAPSGVAVRLDESDRTIIVTGQKVSIGKPKAYPEVNVNYAIQSGVI